MVSTKSKDVVVQGNNIAKVGEARPFYNISHILEAQMKM